MITINRAQETALDTQWAHAIAPSAKILLVLAESDSLYDMFQAIDYATSHADYVSLSFGTSEFEGQQGFDYLFDKPGVSVFVATGDLGANTQYPSTSPRVIAVGGTTLNYNGYKFANETG
jgi:subtilase family serine protease